ncbi:MAG: hypothetical protein PW734_07385 [Verrucomicrobium sp.]|nr:hypothetical protein [Verrucomicrobium sp.]
MATLQVVGEEIRRRLADPQDAVHAIFHRHINPDGEPGGWVQDGWAEPGRSVSPQAHLGKDVIVFGPNAPLDHLFDFKTQDAFTVLGPGVAVTGRSVIGPGTRILGKSRIEDSYVTGSRDANAYLRDSTVRESYIHGSELRRATVTGQALVSASKIKNGIVEAKADLFMTTVKGGSRVGPGVWLNRCRVLNGVAVEAVPYTRMGETIRDNRYALAVPERPSLWKGALDRAAALFERPRQKESPGQSPDRGVSLRK